MEMAGKAGCFVPCRLHSAARRLRQHAIIEGAGGTEDGELLKSERQAHVCAAAEGGFLGSV